MSVFCHSGYFFALFITKKIAVGANYKNFVQHNELRLDKHKITISAEKYELLIPSFHNFFVYVRTQSQSSDGFRALTRGSVHAGAGHDA